MDSKNQELNEKTKRAAELKQQLEEAKVNQSLLQAEFDSVAREVQNILEALEIDSVKMHGFNFYTQTTESVKVPKEPAAKKALFDFLEEKGIFFELASINSQTLNKLYREMSEEAAKEGIVSFTLPGVDAPTSFTDLRMRKI